MKGIKKFALFTLFMLQFFCLSAQINKYGVPQIRNYSTEITLGSEQAWCITKDKFGNIYFGNQEKGVTRFDGTKWSNIKIGNNSRIFSLTSDERGIVYVGSAYEFGYLQPDNIGNLEYVSLARRTDSIADIRNIYSILSYKENIYYLSPRFIYVYNYLSDSLSKLNFKNYKLNTALRLVNINDHLVLSDNNEGMFELHDASLSPLPGGDFFRRKICMVILKYDDEQILVGTYNTGLFLYNFITGTINKDFIDPKLNERLKESVISCGANLGRDLFAIGTGNNEGIIILNRKGEVIEQITKDNSDLEDNTMYSLYCDNKDKSELWISTLGVISKAYPFVKKFTAKQGFESAVNEISKFQDDYYFSSDDGVYKSYFDKNNTLAFKRIDGINDQVFPLQLIKTKSEEFLLAGTPFGAFKIDKGGRAKNIQTDMYNVAEKKMPSNFKKILQSSIDPDVIYFGLEMGGVSIFRYKEGSWKYIDRIRNIQGIISGILEKNEGGLWILTDDPSGLYEYKISGSDSTLRKFGPEDGIREVDLNTITLINNELYISSGSGIIRYDKSSGKFVADNSVTNGFSEGKNSLNLYKDSEGDIWYSGIDSKYMEVLYRNKVNGRFEYHGFLNLLPNAQSWHTKEYDSRLFFLKAKITYIIDKADLVTDTAKLTTYFVSINVGKDSTVLNGSFYTSIDRNRRVPVVYPDQSTIPEFGYDMNKIAFEWTTPYYIEELSTEYSYKLEGLDENWSKWEGFSYGKYIKKEYNNLPYGSYNFRVRTKTITGLSANELNYKFVIRKPWYATIVAFIGFALAVIAIIYLIIKAYTKKLKNENIRLEGIVAERTAVVVKQKEELESSIHYAKRIQMALLPPESILADNFRNYFILFKPRDIVSGDFYWMIKKNNRLYIVAADCTGHGVPGAFMSLLGMSFLDEIIDKESSTRADQVLGELRQHVTESLKQVGGENEAKDGMDMGLLVVDFNTSRIEFSGAYNPCFKVRKLTEEEIRNYNSDDKETQDGLISNGKYALETVLASKMPIGISPRINEKFVFNDWPIEPGYSYYLFSDGYIDQFGGPDGRKFMKKNFKRLILDIQDQPMSIQKELLDQNLKSWIGAGHQIDDILVLGFRTD
jgi:serine phosphatase RsbU (regulator of sigma subunit)